MKKIHMSSEDLESHVHTIIREMMLSEWKPDYIVGITRGGLTPANMLSQYLNIPMHSLDVSMRDNMGQESNLWMADDASNGVNILIVDDINDKGTTLSWIANDWRTSNPGIAADAFGSNVRVAVLVNKLSSTFDKISYSSYEIGIDEADPWIVFSWENWWHRKHNQ